MRARKHIVIFGAITLLFLLGALFIGFTSAKKMENIICNEFNQQQLALAKRIASQMEDGISSIKRALLTLSLSPSIQYLEPSWANPMGIIMPSVRNNGVLEIRMIDARGETAYLVDNKEASHTLKGNFYHNDYFKWCSLKENKGKVYTTSVTKEYPGKLTMFMATPVYQESIDEVHPLPTHRFSGVLVFTIDATSMAEKVAKDIRSGKTGYAWVMDDKGVFLYHLEKQFIGENAFEIRREREPKISFDRINFIQKEWMLKGKEGMSWYISGWHREMKGKIKKLIAYAPVYLDKKSNKNCFSVAVVAPINEIQGEIRSVYARQFYIMLSIIVAIIFFGVYIVNFERRWTQTLIKTAELRRSTDKLTSLGRLSAGIAHEINNPIAIILGFTDVLLERTEPKSKNHEILKIIERQATNCKRIVEDLMSFARVPEKTEYSTDINQALEKIISIVQNTLLTKKIFLKKNLTDGLPRIRGDSSELQQVFINLINNAVAAMDGGGTLTVSTKISDSPNRVDVFFTDTGHGIKEEYRDKIFDPFFTTRKVGEGIGLGLSVSYGIIKKYEGEMRFETITEEEDREKHGTTFIVSLPIVPEKQT